MSSWPAARPKTPPFRRGRAELLLLHVMALPASFVASEPPADYLVFLSQARRETARGLAAMLARAKKSGIRVEAKLVKGVPAQQIVRMARRRGADLIVIGTHGRTGLGRLLMGSVADHALRFAPCPVLTVRGRQAPVPASTAGEPRLESALS